MQFPALSTLFLLALSLSVSAAPNVDNTDNLAMRDPAGAAAAAAAALAQEDPEVDDSGNEIEIDGDENGNPVSDAAIHGNCTPGKYYCASVFRGNHRICRSCAIVVGGTGHRCLPSASCARHNGSCKKIGGAPKCV